MDIQVPRDHYFNWQYNHKARWLTYFYQLQLFRKYKCTHVCEVGPGHGWVKLIAKDLGVQVTTVDFDPALKPDVVASIEALPFASDSFDAVCAFEVLEHMPYEQFEQNVAHLARVSKKYVFLSLPDHRSILLHVLLKIPFISYIDVFFKVPSGKAHVFDGQHYWEVGKKGYPPARIEEACARAGLRVVETFVPSDAPSNIYFVLEKH